MTFELTCPHGAVPLGLTPGDTLREWHRCLTVAKRHHWHWYGCECGETEMVVRVVETPVRPAQAQRSPSWDLWLCTVDGCGAVAVEQRDGDWARICFAHGEWGMRPARMAWTNQGRVVSR